MKIQLGSRKGGMEILILITIVIAGFFFAGGQSAFEMIYPDDEDLTPTTTPAAQQQQQEWAIELINVRCDSASQISNVSVGLHGPQNGYYTIFMDGVGVSTNEYTPSPQGDESVILPLPNTLGFNSKPWSISLYGGGSLFEGSFSGGTKKAEKQFTATACQ